MVELHREMQLIDCEFPSWNAESSAPSAADRIADDPIAPYRRVVRYKAKTLPGVWSPVEERQFLLETSELRRVYFVSAHAYTHGPLLTDSFFVRVHWVLAAVNDDRCRLHVSGEVAFIQRVPFVRSMIENRVIDGMREHYDLLLPMLSDYSARPPAANAPQSQLDSALHEQAPELRRIRFPSTASPDSAPPVLTAQSAVDLHEPTVYATDDSVTSPGSVDLDLEDEFDAPVLRTCSDNSWLSPHPGLLAAAISLLVVLSMWCRLPLIVYC